MKIQFVGDGTPAYQTYTVPGGCLEKWQTITSGVVPEWVETAPPGYFLVDGRPNPGPVAKPKAKEPAKPTAKPGKE